jgi:hypothetical protein
VPGVLVCRLCAAAIGRLLETTTDAVLVNLWRHTIQPPKDTRRPATLVTCDDAQGHSDLGWAYAEMGLGVEAIREFAVVLRPDVPKPLAAEAFFRIFLTRDARPEALSDLILAFRKNLR